MGIKLKSWHFCILLLATAGLLVGQLVFSSLVFSHGEWQGIDSAEIDRYPIGTPFWKEFDTQSKKITSAVKGKASLGLKVNPEIFEFTGGGEIEGSTEEKYKLVWGEKAKGQTYTVVRKEYETHWSPWWYKLLHRSIPIYGATYTKHEHILAISQELKWEEFPGTRQKFERVEADPPGDPLSDEPLIPTTVPNYYSFELDFSWFGIDDIGKFEVTTSDGKTWDITEDVQRLADQIDVYTKIQLDGQTVPGNPPIIDASELTLGLHTISIIHVYTGEISGTFSKDYVFEVIDNTLKISVTEPENTSELNAPAGDLVNFEVTVENLSREEQRVRLSAITDSVGYLIEVEERDFTLLGEESKSVNIIIPTHPIVNEGDQINIIVSAVSPLAASSTEIMLTLGAPVRSVQVKPTSLSIGDTITVTGSGFTPGEEVSIWLDTAPGELIELAATVANVSSAFEVKAVIPRNTMSWDTGISAIGEEGIAIAVVSIIPESLPATSSVAPDDTIPPSPSDTSTTAPSDTSSPGQPGAQPSTTTGNRQMYIPIGVAIGVGATLLFIFLRKRSAVKKTIGS
jgi:hypothetical protein